MCCFSGTVEYVGGTKIFVRRKHNGRQALVYEMDYRSKDDLAMILPIPTPRNSKEDAVEFISLKKYRNFFVNLEKGFPRPRAKSVGGAGGGFGAGSFDAEPLVVKDVGDFEASFVPAVADFSRLDERFRLPEATWTETVPQYRDWGFAVFKLKSEHSRTHPMAFTFPSRYREDLFFPMLHIHDGEVHDLAEFDHTLYAQNSIDRPRSFMDWRESTQPAGMFMVTRGTKGLVDDTGHVYQKNIAGEQKNEDIVV